MTTPCVFGLLSLLATIGCSAGSADEMLHNEQLNPAFSDIPSKLTLHESAEILDSGPDAGLKLPLGAYAEWRPEQHLSTDAGTLLMWVKPLWDPGDHASHTFVTFKWTGSDQSYFALSQGWWEPQGARKLYVVLSNQQYLFCFMPREFDYTHFLPNQWTQLGVTWQAGNPGFIRLFADGKILCDRRIAFTGGRRATDPAYLGSDLGADISPHGRASQMVIKSVTTASRAFDFKEMQSAYVRGGGTDHQKWIIAIAGGGTPADVAKERRVIQDEDTGWSSSKLETQQRIARIKAAGFNIYMPNVWNGAQAFYDASNAPVSTAVTSARHSHYDPLAYLLEVAHREGIAVHPWFIVGRNPGGSNFPESYTDGAPQQSFNVHDEKFKEFVAALVVDVAKRYDVDGLNLDYIRAMGPCADPACVESYAHKYRRSISADWKSQEDGQTVPSLIEWNKSAVTDIVRRISQGVRAMKPHAILTIDTIPFDHSRQHEGLDEESWIHEGLIDALIDMAYDDPIDVAGIDHAMRAFTPAKMVVNIRDYDVIGNEVVDRSPDVMSDYIDLIRRRWPGAGIGFYHYPHLSDQQVVELGSEPFAQVAAPMWRR